MGSGACAGCVGSEGAVEEVGLALRGLGFVGLEGSAGGWIVYLVDMRVCEGVRSGRLENEGEGTTYG